MTASRARRYVAPMALAISTAALVWLAVEASAVPVMLTAVLTGRATLYSLFTD